MRTYVDQRFLEERERFALRATCERCQHFVTATETCSLDFPAAPHLDRVHARAQVGDAIFFCKHFELG